MNRQIFHYHFQDCVDMDYVEAELVLATFNVESLYGPARARLEAAHCLDRDQRTLVIDATSEVGQDFNRLFVGGLLREHGPDSFLVRRIEKEPMPTSDQ